MLWIGLLGGYTILLGIVIIHLLMRVRRLERWAGSAPEAIASTQDALEAIEQIRQS